MSNPSDSLWFCFFSDNGNSKVLVSMPRTTRRAQAMRPRHPLRTVKRTITSIWGIFGILAVAVTLLGAVVFFPRLSMSSDATLDPSDPFATPFILHNDGYFSAYSTEIICKTVAKVNSMGISVLGIGFTSPDLINRYVDADGQIEFTCPLRAMFPAPVTDAEIQVYIAFTAWIFPKSCTKKCFHAKTWKAKDNNLRWFINSVVGKCERPTVVVKQNVAGKGLTFGPSDTNVTIVPYSGDGKGTVPDLR